MKRKLWTYLLWSPVAILLLLWISAPRFLASDQPVLLFREGRLVLYPVPAARPGDLVLWKAPVPFDPQGIDRAGSGFVSPAENRRRGGRHYLGTDELGRDTLAGLIAGISASLKTGVFASLLAVLLALFPALISGYYASERKRAHLFVAAGDLLCGLLLAWTLYVSLLVSLYAGLVAVAAICLIWLFVRDRLRRYGIREFPWLSFRYSPDAWLLRFTDAYELFPKIILLLVVFAFTGWKPAFMALLLGVAGWPFFYRYLRADSMRIKSLPFIRAALLQKVPFRVLMLRYFLPSLLPLILSLLPFMFIAAVLAETALGFIGLGLDPSEITLGRMIAEGRTFPAAWWLLLFPSLVLSIMMGLCYVAGKKLAARFTEEK